jgi:hypothetical protein
MANAMAARTPAHWVLDISSSQASWLGQCKTPLCCPNIYIKMSCVCHVMPASYSRSNKGTSVYALSDKGSFAMPTMTAVLLGSKAIWPNVFIQKLKLVHIQGFDLLDHRIFLAYGILTFINSLY